MRPQLNGGTFARSLSRVSTVPKTMSDFSSGLLGALVGATAGIVSSLLTASRKEAFERRQWLLERRREAYVQALRSIARATIVPIGISIERLEKWYDELAVVRESLVTLQGHAPALEGAPPIADLFSVLDRTDFVTLATEAAAMQDESWNPVGFVLLPVGDIRKALDRVLSCITADAKLTLAEDYR